MNDRQRLLGRPAWVGLVAAVLAQGVARGQAAHEWTPLTDGGTLDAWRNPHGQWTYVGEIALKPDDRNRLLPQGDSGKVLYNGRWGRTLNLVSREDYGDVELAAEFMVPEGSNSGVKFQGLYEIQILDSAKKVRVTASDCGGIYPRAELLPSYHYLDEGYPPASNAARPAGEWQTLEVVFRAPRFDAVGRKTANARFEKVLLNGTLIHENIEVPFGTGHAWHKAERAEGPLLLQGDHGPVAFRGIKVRRLAEASESASAHASGSEINAPFTDKSPDVAAFVERFETGDREVYVRRDAIVAALGLRPGMVVADIGAGTGLFTRLIARAVGSNGVVFAVDINPSFLAHIEETAQAEKLTQIHGVLGNQVSPALGQASLDLAYLCDAYHHLEKPAEYLRSLHRMLREDGRLVIVEMDKHDGASEFVQRHIRATQAEFIQEIEKAGFRRIEADGVPGLKENFFAVFQKSDEPGHE